MTNHKDQATPIILKKKIEHYSNCCGAYMENVPDSDVCPDCKEHCTPMIGEYILKSINEIDELVEALRWSLKTINALVKTYNIEKTSNDPSKTNWDKLYIAKQALARAGGK